MRTGPVTAASHRRRASRPFGGGSGGGGRGASSSERPRVRLGPGPLADAPSTVPARDGARGGRPVVQSDQTAAPAHQGHQEGHGQ